MEQYKRGLAWLRDDDGGADVFIRENIWWHVSDAERTVLARSSAEAGVERAVVEAPGPALGITLEQTTNAPILELSALREARQHLTVTGLLEEIEARVRVNGALVRLWLRENVRLAEGDARGEATSAPTPGLRQA
jgi:hypothetical protein